MRTLVTAFGPSLVRRWGNDSILIWYKDYELCTKSLAALRTMTNLGVWTFQQDRSTLAVDPHWENKVVLIEDFMMPFGKLIDVFRLLPGFARLGIQMGNVKSVDGISKEAGFSAWGFLSKIFIYEQKNLTTISSPCSQGLLPYQGCCLSMRRLRCELSRLRQGLCARSRNPSSPIQYLESKHECNLHALHQIP